jgi:hypothetical protein
MFRARHVVLLSMIAVAAAMRVFDHPWNLAPVGAVALFAGAHFRDRRCAFAAPLLAMFASDVALGLAHHDMAFYTFHPLMLLVYGCYALYVLLGAGIRSSWRAMDRGHQTRAALGAREAVARGERLPGWALKALPVAAATLVGALAFFVITNFGDWLLYYEHTWSGLMKCYAAGIPFFRTTLAGDAAYVAILFGGYAILRERVGVTAFEGERASNSG